MIIGIIQYLKKPSYLIKPILAVSVSIPIIATIQGAYFFHCYTTYHRDAPHPINPCKGIVISKSLHPNDTTQSTEYCRKRTKWMPWWWFNYRKYKNNDVVAQKCRPLHLLVIGDSLAAGVGSTSGTPILPEAIARTLSAALGGLPVLWECHGTPGAIASHVLNEIEGLKASRMTLNTRTDPFCDSRHSRTRLFNFFKRILFPKMAKKTHISEQEVFYNKKHYDVVVLLTGMNDLKTKLLPFMNSIDRTKNDSGIYEMMKLIIISLREHMKSSEKDNTYTHMITKEESQYEASHRIQPRSVIVLPSFPTSPIPLLKYPPLCWILHFFFQVIDKQKYELSLEYSEDVLFVDVPSKDFMNDIENGTHTIDEKQKNETLLLNLKDVSDCDSKAIKEKILKHAVQSVYSDSSMRENEIYYDASLNDSLPNGIFNYADSKLISFDGIHPNNHGYNLWGHHIAENIILFWK